MRTRVGVVALAATIPLTALVVDPGGWYPFGPSKWLVVTTLLVGGAGALWWDRPLRCSRPVTLAAWLLVGWLAIAALGGEDRVYAWIGTPERHLGVIAWALCALALTAGQSLDPAGDRWAFTGALAITGVGVGGLATAQALGWEPSLFAVTAGRLTATMGSAAYLGALTALVLPALAGIALDHELDRRLRTVAALGLVPLTVACLGSGARAAWLGLAAATIVVAVGRRRWLLAHRRLAAAGAVAALVGLTAVVLLSPVGHRLSAATDPDAAGGRSRVDEWRVATRVIARHPVLGVGPEGYRIAFAEGATDAYQRAYGRDPLPDRAHSGPLDVALAGGLPALAAWGVAVALMARAAFRAVRTERAWLAGLGAGLVAHFTGQLLLFPTAELEPVAWLLAGLLIAATTDRTELRARVVARPLAAAMGVVAIVALLAGSSDVMADRHAAAAVAADQRGDTEAAVREAGRAVDLRPDELRLHLLLARALVADGRSTSSAIAVVDDALRVSPGDPIARHERARLLVQRAGATHRPDDLAAARADVDALVASDPTVTASWMLAGAVAELADDQSAAEAAFLRAQALSPRDPSPSIELARLDLAAVRALDETAN